MRSLKSSEFDKVYSKGKRISGKLISLVVLPSESIGWGISISKRLGNAVIRNLLKRRIREAIRKIEPQLSTGANIVILPRGSVPTATQPLEELTLLAKKAGLVS